MKTSLPISAILKNKNNPKWPQWFSIDKYDCLADLTVEQFLHQLDIRLTLHHSPTFPNGRKLSDDRKWRQIQLGDVLLDINLIPQSSFPSVTQLNHIDLEGISQTLKLRFGDEYVKQEPQTLMPVLGMARKQVLVAIDLEGTDNKTILGNLEYLLNQLRQQLALSEPTEDTKHKANEKTFKKLLTYKIIPYLDLMLYCHNHSPLDDENWKELSFTQNALITLLFNGELDLEAFKKTHLPFYRNILTNEPYLIKLLANMRQNTWALETRMRNI